MEVNLVIRLVLNSILLGFRWGCKARVLVLSHDIRCRIHEGSRKHRRKPVLAVSKIETFSSNGRLKSIKKNPLEQLNGANSSSANSAYSSHFEEFESNNQLRKFVRNGELDEGLKVLDSMVYRGDIPDIIAGTSLIRGFCKSGKTRKATQVMNILEESGAVLDVITYNVLISGYCKSGEIDNALQVLERMSVDPLLFRRSSVAMDF